MKKIIILLIIFSSTISYSQRQKATLFFRDGTSIEGLASITAFSEIKFRKNKKSNKVIYNSKTVKSLIIEDNKSNKVKFEYKILLDKSNPRLLTPVENGKITLYKKIARNDGGIAVSRHFMIYSLYISKNNEDIAHYIANLDDEFYHFFLLTFAKDKTDLSKYNTTKKHILKKLIPFIKDCPELINRIENKEYKKKSIIDIIQFYNKNCGTTEENKTKN